MESEPDWSVKQVMEAFVVRAERIRGGGVDPSVDLSLIHILQRSKLYGVAIDSISGRIAKQLYQNANISITGFENKMCIRDRCIGDSLNSRQKSIIDRCVRKLYIDIALSLELFVNGSLNIFNHQTNVDLDNRFTVYGIRDTAPKVREDKAR